MVGHGHESVLCVAALRDSHSVGSITDAVRTAFGLHQHKSRHEAFD